MLLTNVHWHNHSAVAMFSKEPDCWDERRHWRRKSTDTRQILKHYLNKLRRNQMSLCLVLLLVAIGINWWSGWEPFTHPFQTPWS
jgi:hypothetical protein